MHIRSGVSAAVLWPTSRWTTLMFARELIARDAQACRKSCSRSPLQPSTEAVAFCKRVVGLRPTVSRDTGRSIGRMPSQLDPAACLTAFARPRANQPGRQLPMAAHMNAHPDVMNEAGSACITGVLHRCAGTVVKQILYYQSTP